MAQFSDGPVEWPWCIQLVHGAHSSLWSHWCLVAFPSTRINAAPLGGQKWERVSNSKCRKARKSQSMTIDGKPSTTTTTASKPLLPQEAEALTWAALCPVSLFFLLSPSDSQSPRQAKAGAPQASESSSTSSRSLLSYGAKKPRVQSIFPNKRVEHSTAQQRYERLM